MKEIETVRKSQQTHTRACALGEVKAVRLAGRQAEEDRECKEEKDSPFRALLYLTKYNDTSNNDFYNYDKNIRTHND